MANLYSVERLQQVISEGLDGAEVMVTDLTGTSDHFKAIVVCAAFEGKSLVARHQLVYRAIGPDVGGPIHALSLETYTPAQWNEKISG